MSIEALLEAAKYVELTGEPRPINVTPEITAASHGREKEVVEKQERKEDDQHVTEMFGIESNSAQEGLPTTIPQTFADIEQQQQETGPRPEPGPGSTSHDVEQSVADSREEEKITDSGSGLSQQEMLVSQLQMAQQQQQQPSVAVEQINPVGLLTQQNIMRHPGYDVSWSYSAPTSLKSNASSSPNGNLLEPATSDALGSRVDDTNSDDGEDGKKSGVREVHNKLEKNRRAHLKECFDALKSQIPTLQDRKVKISNSNILSGACRYIGALKRKEKELEHELDRLVKEKIQKQKLLQRLKVEKGKDLHRGMAWDQQGSVISGDLVQDRNLVEQQEQEVEAERSHEQDEEDRYSTSTASEAEEEERKSQGFCMGVPSVVTTGALMTITVTTASTAVSGCQTTQSYGSDSMPSGSYRHPLKSHLLREHRAQLAREAAAATTSPTVASIMSEATRTTSHLMTRALNIVKPMNSMVTVVPNMPISPSARPTVSQLLGKHTVPIRQPVRKQAPSNPLQTVLQPTSIPIQRYQAPGMGFTRPSGEFAVRPSGTTQPVVTIGVTQALQSRPDLTSLGIKLSRGQLLPVVSQGLKLPNGQVVTNTPSLGPSLSIVSSSLPSSFLQATIPGGNTPLTQPMVSPIALSTPVKQVFLTHQNLAGYTSLNPSLLPPFVPPTCQTVGSSLVTNLNQSRPPQVTLIPNINPRSHPFMPIHNSPVPRVANVSVRNSYMNATTSTGNLPLNSAVLGAHQITTLTSSSTTMFPPGNHHHKQSNVTSKPKTHKSDRVISPRSKTLLTTSQIAQTLLANGGMSKVKTVTAGSNKTQCTVTQSVVTMS